MLLFLIVNIICDFGSFLYIMICSDHYVLMTFSWLCHFNLTIYCHVQVCLTTRWSPGTSSIWMSLIFSLQNVGFVTSLYGNIMFSDLQKCSCWWCKSCNVGGWKSVQSLSITIENSYLKSFSKILLNWKMVDRFLHQSYSQYPLLGFSAFCWCKGLKFFVLCETFLRVLSPFY